VERSRSAWWWLALPVLGVAAWAAFDATLGMVGARDPELAPAPLLDGAGAVPSQAVVVQDELPVAAAGVVAIPAATAPEPSATPAERAAAKSDGKPAAKRKPAAPKEQITEQDRRALERVLERATEQAPR